MAKDSQGNVQRYGWWVGTLASPISIRSCIPRLALPRARSSTTTPRLPVTFASPEGSPDHDEAIPNGINGQYFYEKDALFFEPEAALKRLKKTGDLFAPALRLRQRLPKPFLEVESNTEPEPHSNSKALETYRQKRNFSKTSEPPPSTPRSSRQGNRRLFVIQKHAASRLHYHT
jgi:hypothetical protein